MIAVVAVVATVVGLFQLAIENSSIIFKKFLMISLKSPTTLATLATKLQVYDWSGNKG